MQTGEALSEEELEKIEERANAATGGPWKSFIEGRDMTSGSSFIMTQGDDLYLDGGTTCDQDFVAAARTDVPRLVQEIRRLKTQSSDQQKGKS